MRSTFPSLTVWLTLVCAHLPQIQQAAAAQSAEFEIRVLDHDTGRPIPVRMHLRDARGKPVKPPGTVFWHDHFVIPGVAVLELRPGTYTFEMERGPEYKIRTGHFTLKQGDADSTEVRMERFVDMKQEGWWSGDLHIHRPPEDIPLLMAAEDLHIAPVITWWNDKNAWDGQPIPADLLRRADEDRLYHVMAGEDERGGGALLYFNLPEPLPIRGSQREYPSSCEFLKMSRRFPGVHVDVEKPFWWDVPIWIASGMVDSIGLCNNHQQRDGMLSNEAWGKPRDRIAFPDPHGNGRWSEHIYHQLLESGIRLPPSAGSASGVLPNPLGYNRVYVHCGPSLDYRTWWTNLRAGQVVVTNGPLIREPRVNNQLPGHVFRAADGEKVVLQTALNLSLREQVDYLEIVKNGRVEHEVRLDAFAESGGKLPEVVFTESGWMLIRAVTSHPRTYRFASTGPYYIEIGGQPRISRQAVQFFADWVHQRARQLDIADPVQRESVIQYHRAARDFWAKRLAAATAD
jgi:hypothetical protein